MVTSKDFVVQYKVMTNSVAEMLQVSIYLQKKWLQWLYLHNWHLFLAISDINRDFISRANELAIVFCTKPPL
jgi:hypothetical protein